MVRGKLWAIVRREYAERVLTRWFLVATIFGPIVFGLLMLLPSYLASRTETSADVARIVILDATGTELGQRVAAELNGGIAADTSLTDLRVVQPAELAAAEQEARTQALRGRYQGYLVLDEQSLAGISARYAGSNATAFRDVAQIQQAVRREVLAQRLEQAGLPPEQADALKSIRLELEEEQLTGRGGGGSGRVSILFAISIAMLLYVTIFLYGQTVLRGVMEEKQTRVAEIVVSSVSSTTLLAGKVLGVGAVGLTQLAIWLVAGFGMMRVRTTVLGLLGIEGTPLILPGITPGMILTLTLFFVLGYLFYAALFAAIGAIVSSEQEAQQAQIPVVMFLVLSVAFIQPVLNRPDSSLAQTLSIIPFSAPILMPLRMSVVQVSAWQLTLSIVELLLGCIVVVWLAARIYRTGILMYGKRPTVREIARWVRAR